MLAREQAQSAQCQIAPWHLRRSATSKGGAGVRARTRKARIANVPEQQPMAAENASGLYLERMNVCFSGKTQKCKCCQSGSDARQVTGRLWSEKPAGVRGTTPSLKQKSRAGCRGGLHYGNLRHLMQSPDGLWGAEEPPKAEHRVGSRRQGRRRGPGGQGPFILICSPWGLPCPLDAPSHPHPPPPCLSPA